MAVRVTRLFLVRHGRAAAGWDVDPDPPLDDVGVRQAHEAAAELGRHPALDIVSSLLRRCRETAAPLSVLWGRSPLIEPGVAEIPSPEGIAMADRVAWLRVAMQGRWADLGPRYTAFRDGVVRTVIDRAAASPDGAVVVSHFIAINAVIGAAVGDDRLVLHSLDNASITEIEVADDRLALVSVGREADTLIR
ncbi:MAG: histidine phosphatase family protein [Ilumatobacteraceae bacterium]